MAQSSGHWASANASLIGARDYGEIFTAEEWASLIYLLTGWKIFSDFKHWRGRVSGGTEDAGTGWEDILRNWFNLERVGSERKFRGSIDISKYS